MRRFRLSSFVAAMLVAGVLVGVNVRHIAKAPAHLYGDRSGHIPGSGWDVTYEKHGWPFVSHTRFTMRIPKGNESLEFRESDQLESPVSADGMVYMRSKSMEVNAFNLVLNGVIVLLLCAAALFASEIIFGERKKAKVPA